MKSRALVVSMCAGLPLPPTSSASTILTPRENHKLTLIKLNSCLYEQIAKVFHDGYSFKKISGPEKNGP